jgi:hypothetical protein
VADRTVVEELLWAESVLTGQYGRMVEKQL